MSLDTSADIDLMFDVFNEPAPARKKTVDFDAVREKTKKVFERHRNVLLKRRAGNEDVDDMVETEGTKKLKLEHQINNAGEAHVSEHIRNIKTHKLDTLESCMHEVVLPPNAELKPLTINTVKPAKVYAFPLDPFQKESVLCLENQQSVLVSAHTSAGKTVVAEYAIAMALRDKQRVIYTTPIKALSNQKYREFLDEFKDVGLMTGDITINPSASCLVMTTEILRSMLYKGSELMREVGWVVFDEIHYMRDKERGVVWEETIILLPDNVHYVFLSATIPNARQFAEWIVFLHKQPCHVVYTEYRPTPLEHYLFPAGGDGLYQVVNTSSEFNEVNFMAAMEKLANGDGAKGDQRGSKGGIKNGGGSNCYKIVKLIMERNFAPVIVFSFSKRDCEKYSQEMSSLDFNTEEEAKLVEEVFSNAIDTLKEEDQMLPQVKMIYPLLQKGIGVHHSGLLPLLKEVIEILFGEGLIKALFATETFAMGLNMPARTVLFTSARKFDGKDFRWVTSGEYIQMSGRAGRRGLDDKGLVILMVDEKMTPATGKQIIKGQADPLNSSFHLTYSMVLNLLRVEEINPEYMLERSFFQFQNYGAIPELLDELKTLEAKYNEISIHNEAEVASYHKLKSKLKILNRERLTYIQNPKKLMPFMTSGRVVRVCVGEVDFGYCPVVKFYENKHNKNQVVLNEEKDYNILVIAYVTKETAHEKSITRMEPYPLENAFGGEAVAVTVKPTMLTEVSKINMKNMNNMHCRDFRMVKIAELQRVKRNHGFAQLDAEKDMKIKKPFFKAVVTKIEEYEGLIASHALHNNKDFTAISEKYEEKAQIGLEVKEVKQRLKQKQSLLQMQELRHRKRILRRMGYAKASDVIELKGRIACEIDSADELVITELLFNGMFNNLSPQQCCAILSCFVFQERADEMPKLKEELSAPLLVIQDTARRIAKVSQECKLTLDEDEYVESFKPHLMNLVYAWSNGSSFINIIQMTDVMEGSIIRCMRRLEELLGQMRLAAKNLGNIELENKFSDATMSIKRDIVFAASLYL